MGKFFVRIFLLALMGTIVLEQAGWAWWTFFFCVMLYFEAFKSEKD